MNKDAWTLKDWKNFRTFLTIAISEGKNDTAALSVSINDYITNRELELKTDRDSYDEKYAYSKQFGDKTEFISTEQAEELEKERLYAIKKQRQRKALRTRMLREAPPCPQCKHGKLIPSGCGMRTIECTHKCGYSKYRGE